MKGATVSQLNGVSKAKVNVSLEDAHLLESEDFWPEGVQCRRWYSVRQWKEMCFYRNAKQYDYWDADNDDEREWDVIELPNKV